MLPNHPRTPRFINKQLTLRPTDKLVRSKDPNNRISRESLYGYRTTAPDAKYVADQKAWNGKGYQCYTCRHEFNTLAKLNNHLGSERRKPASPLSKLLS